MMPKSTEFLSPFSQGIERFLQHKRALGRRYDTEEAALHLFDRFLVERQVRKMEAVTPQVIEAFLASRPRRSPRSFNHLLGVMHRLFGWLVAHDIVDRSPVQHCARRGGTQRTPFILAPEHARRLLELVSQLPDVRGSERRGQTYRVVFAVLYGLGLRVSEVCRLFVQDVDQKRNLFFIRQTKFGKDRLVPFGPKMAKVIKIYLAEGRATSHGGPAANAPLFTVHGERPLNRQDIGAIFRRLRPRLGITVPEGVSPPRVHDLRHSFAVRCLLGWYRQGIDPSRRLLHLSTFLGHVQPESTAVYLTITSDLLREAGGRFEDYARPLLKEVRQ